MKPALTPRQYEELKNRQLDYLTDEEIRVIVDRIYPSKYDENELPYHELPNDDKDAIFFDTAINRWDILRRSRIRRTAGMKFNIMHQYEGGYSE
jgi:hypothetical protein